jgi:microcystin-dependent protein
MADPFVAEIRMFAFQFAPTGWAQCNGQLLPISQNTALFSLLGTTYGGNGMSTFALPDLQGSSAMHPGQGPGLSLYDLGQTGGQEIVTLIESEMPSHAHQVPNHFGAGTYASPGPSVGLGSSGAAQIYTTTTADPIASPMLGVAGGGLPHTNMQPYLTVNFCIAMQGVFPQRP